MGHAQQYEERIAAVCRTPGLLAFWDFVQREDGPGGDGRFVAHVPGESGVGYPLEARNLARDYWSQGREATDDDFPLLGRGPFGQALYFGPLTQPKLRPVLMVPRHRLHDTALDVKGPGQSVSMVAWVVRESGNHAIAGIWHEGTDIAPASDRPTKVEQGRRQYALFAGLAANPGAASAHVSENGRSSFGDRYARHLAVTPEKIPAVGAKPTAAALDAAWTVVGFVFDNDHNFVAAYLNGVATETWVDNPKESAFYRYAYRAWRQGKLAQLPGSQPGEDGSFPREQYYLPPEDEVLDERVERQTDDERILVRTYEYTKVRTVLQRNARGDFAVVADMDLVALKTNPYWFGHDLYAPPTAAAGGPFTIGRVLHSRRGAGMVGYIGGVAVFDRALTASQMRRLSEVGRTPIPLPR